MKNKVTLLVLVAEIIAIVVLHTQRTTTPTTDTDRSANIQSESQFHQSTDKRVSYTSLK